MVGGPLLSLSILCNLWTPIPWHRYVSLFFYLVGEWQWGTVKVLLFMCNSLFWGGGTCIPLHFPQHLRLQDGLKLLSVSLWIGPSLFPCLTCCQGFIFLPRRVFLRSTILFLLLDHTLQCRHSFLHTPLQPMELESFFAPIFQDLIVILVDIIQDILCKTISIWLD